MILESIPHILDLWDTIALWATIITLAASLAWAVLQPMLNWGRS